MPGISAVKTGLPFSKKGFSFVQYWTTLKAAMTNKPSDAYSLAANTFIKTLVDNGVWAKLDFLYCFNAPTNDGGEALLNWINPGTYNASLAHGDGGTDPVFTAMQGFTGNIANKSYISTNFNPATAGGKYERNSASMGVYINTVGASTAANHIMGSEDGNLFLGPKYSNVFRGTLNSNSDFAQITKNTTPGLISVVRPDATTIKIYKNKTELTSRSVASANVINQLITILRVKTLYEDSQVSMAYMGAGLTAGDIKILYDAYAFFLTL